MLCVLGVLKTAEGLKIKKEMLDWLSKYHDVICVEQEPPGVLFEYPAIKKVIDLAIEKNEPVLYIHTKGAANKVVPGYEKHDMEKKCSKMPKNTDNSDSQVIFRKMWKKEFTDNIQKYLDAVDTDKPTVSCPYTGKEKVTWKNAWVINPAAAKELKKTFHIDKNRFYYERMFTGTDIDVIGIIDGNVDTKNRFDTMWNSVWKYM